MREELTDGDRLAPGGRGFRTANGRTSLTWSSSPNRPSSIAWSTAVATTVFETLASMNSVSRVVASPPRCSPCPTRATRPPPHSRTTATLRPGRRPAAIRSRIARSRPAGTVARARSGVTNNAPRRRHRRSAPRGVTRGPRAPTSRAPSRLPSCGRWSHAPRAPVEGTFGVGGLGCRDGDERRTAPRSPIRGVACVARGAPRRREEACG